MYWTALKKSSPAKAVSYVQIDLKSKPRLNRVRLTIKPPFVVRMIIVSVLSAPQHIGLPCPVVARRSKSDLVLPSSSEDGS